MEIIGEAKASVGAGSQWNDRQSCTLGGSFWVVDTLWIVLIGDTRTNTNTTKVIRGKLNALGKKQMIKSAAQNSNLGHMKAIL